MRPHPQEPEERDDRGRIIYIGDVRRRRVAEGLAAEKRAIGTTIAITLLAAACWCFVVVNVPPARLLTYLAFFSPLWVAGTGAVGLGLFAFGRRSGSTPRLDACLLRGAVIMLLLVANLALVAAHRWNAVAAGISVFAAVVLDVALRRRWWPQWASAGHRTGR